MIQMVLNDWKGQKRESWKRIWRASWDTDGKYFPGAVFLFEYCLYGLDIKTTTMGKFFLGIEGILLLCMVMVNYMFPNKISKAMALAPFTTKEKKQYVKTSFWIKVGGFSLLQICFVLFLGWQGYLPIANGIFLCFSVLCWNVVMGIEEQNGKNGIHTCKLLANIICILCIFGGIRMDYSIFGNRFMTILTSIFFLTECLVVGLLMKREWNVLIEQGMCFDTNLSFRNRK